MEKRMVIAVSGTRRETCPMCNGHGVIHASVLDFDTDHEWRDCDGCGGRGWFTVLVPARDEREAASCAS